LRPITAAEPRREGRLLLWQYATDPDAWRYLEFERAGGANDTPDEDLEAAWATEIERRVHEVETGSVRTVPWSEARQRLLKHLDGGTGT